MMTLAPSLSLPRLRFVLKTDGAQAMMLQDRVSALFANVISSDLDMMAKTFASNSHRSVSIDKLVLDVGDIASYALESELPLRVRHAFAQRLAEQMPWSGGMTEPDSMAPDHVQSDAPSSSFAAQEVQSDKQAAPAAPASQQLQMFLQMGYASGDLSAALSRGGLTVWLEQRLTSLKQSSEQARQQWHRVLIEASFAPTSLQRLLSGLSADVLMQLAEFLLADPQTPYVIRHQPQWEKFLPLCAVHGARLYGDVALPDHAGWWQKLMTTLPADGVEEEVLSEVRRHSSLPAHVCEMIDRMLLPNPENVRHSAAEQKSPIEQEDPVRKKASSEEPVRKKALLVEPEVLPVANAGICLLWPLLPKLFDALGLLQEKTFQDEAAQVVAVCRLDQLIWGFPRSADDANLSPENDPQEAGLALSQEWRTPLNKILCGLPLDTLIDPWTAPTEEEQDVMHQWLANALKQIPALHRLTVNDMRELFLQRPGQLVKKEGRWTLQVDCEGADMLLKTEFGVVWPMSHLTLPWLDLPLEVVWF